MEEGLVTTQGYPIGDLYLMVRAEMKARGGDIRSLTFKNNRQLLLDLGIPPTQFMGTTSQLLSTPLAVERMGMPVDYDNGHNLPPPL
jgi:hypothetical protein